MLLRNGDNYVRIGAYTGAQASVKTAFGTPAMYRSAIGFGPFDTDSAFPEGAFGTAVVGPLDWSAPSSMRELLIRIVDRGGVDQPRGYTDSKTGDVIAVCPDGWNWSIAERTAPFWRIVRVPLTAVECDALLAVGNGDPTLQSCWKRKYKLDFGALPVAARTLIDAARTGMGVIDFTSRLAQVRAATVLKVART